MGLFTKLFGQEMYQIMAISPPGIKDFFKVFIAADEPIREGQDHANALGNHLGIWDFCLSI